ncbi:MAG TPA: hypothetical protein VHM19_08885 [Polyangiales bacterium]|jgi:hypothetical protein|nr:hypothetical protein [Polyangiales bacterium]
MDTPRDRIALALAACMQQLATDRGCEPDDLSADVLSALETYGLECLRLGDELAHDRDTLIQEPRRVSGVFSWNDADHDRETPAFGVRAIDIEASKAGR